jgi:hypothetical protein
VTLRSESAAGLAPLVPEHEGRGTVPPVPRPTDSDQAPPGHAHGLGWADFARIAFVGLCVLLSWLGLGRAWLGFDVSGLVAWWLGDIPSLRKPWSLLGPVA